MKKLFYFIFLLLTSCGISRAQNLVPNPGFESVGLLPCFWITSQTDFSNAVNNWKMPTVGNPDIYSMLVDTSCYNYCFSTYPTGLGQQAPHGGDNMIGMSLYGNGCGFQPDYREYIQVQFTNPLTAGQSYYAEMYVSLADTCQTACNNLGMFFSDTMISSALCTQLNFVPQINETAIISDKTGWVKISGTFTPLTNVQYLTIGNFYSNSSTDTIQLPANFSNAYYFIDDVSLTAGSGSGIQQPSADAAVTVFPNPVINKLTVTSSSKEACEIILYDVVSRKLMQQQFTNAVTLNTSALSGGIYIYEVSNKNGVIKKGRLVKE